MLGRIFNYETSRKFRSSLSKYGISLRLSANIRPVDFTDQLGIDPIVAIYQAGGRPILLKVPLQDCVFFGHLAFPCTANSPSPQIQTLIDFDKGNIKTWSESTLVAFLQKIPAELMGVDAKIFQNLPVRTAIFPWTRWSLEHVLKRRIRSEFSEAKQHGFKSHYAGSKYYGPANFYQIEFEFYRLTNIYKKLLEDGFVVDSEGYCNVTAVALKKDEKYKYFITQGDHRVAAMSALNEKFICLQISNQAISGIVDYNTIKDCPSVINNYLTKTEARDLFCRIYSGTQPKIFY